MLYWPCAKYLNDGGTEYDLITYDGYDTLDRAKNQVDLWAGFYGFCLTEAHIDAYPSGNKICVTSLNVQEGRWENV